MIGVTEIDKGSAYGNIDNKQKQIDCPGNVASKGTLGELLAPA